ncbi:MAG: response regulator [Chloroflexaceae bacterium]|nr:response regulator [Chloroflexaceae bacterium]
MMNTDHILFIGPDDDQHRTLVKQIKELGFRVHIASHLPEQFHTIGLILLGASLEILQRIPHTQLDQMPPVVVLMPHDPFAIERALAAGASDYLPIQSPPRLIRVRLQLWLDHQRATNSSAEDIERLSYERELQIGHQIQSGFLPRTLPELPGWDIATRFAPAYEVGGDFYDVFPMTQQRRYGLVIADVCGKGLGVGAVYGADSEPGTGLRQPEHGPAMDGCTG